MAAAPGVVREPATIQSGGPAARDRALPAFATRGLVVLLVDNFFMWAGFFMVVPLITVHYVDGLGWAASAIGLVLAVRILLQQSLTVFGGMAADRVGPKVLICMGLLVRSIGFGGMAWATNYPVLMGTTVLAAIGGALFDSPRAAAIAALTDEPGRPRFYALSGTVSGVGMAVGPLVGAQLLRLDFGFVALAAGACFAITVVVTLVFLPSITVGRPELASGGAGDFSYGLRMALRDRPFVLFNLLLMGYWFMSVQLSTTLPLRAAVIAGSTDAVSWVYAVNATLNVALQYPLVRLLGRWVAPLPMLVMGTCLVALSLTGIGFSSGIEEVLAFVVVFALGSMLVAPSQQTMTAHLANPISMGSYFGAGGLAVAVGGGLGNYAGGLMYGIGQDSGMPALAWVMFGAVGMSAAMGLAVFNFRHRAAVTMSAPEAAESPS